MLVVILGGMVAGLFWSYSSFPPFHLEVGSRAAESYIWGFHRGETAPYDAFTYRWTRKEAGITIPAIGQRDAEVILMMAGMGRGELPLPSVSVLANSVDVAHFQLNEALAPYEVIVPAALIPTGNLELELRTTTFRPPADSRALGIIVESVAVAPAPASQPGPPPTWLLWGAVSAVGAIALVAGALLARPLPALALAAGMSGGIVALSVTQRQTLGLWAADGPRLIIVSGLVVLVGFGLTRLWLARRETVLATADATDQARHRSPTPVTVASLLWLILWAIALSHLLGVDHPMFRSSDLVMNVHRWEAVANGEWFFTMALPGRSAIPAPYPPALYALLLPLYQVVASDLALKSLAVTVFSAIQIAALAAGAFVVATRAAGPVAGLWAALLYGFAPAGYLLVSQGNFANIFGQAAAGLALAALVSFADWRRPVAALVIVLTLGLAVLGHFGVFLTLLGAAPLLAVAVATTRPHGRRQAVVLMVLFALVLAVCYLAYYQHFVDLVGENTQRIVATTADDAEDLGWSAGFAVEWRRTELALGWLGLPVGLAGVVALARVPNPAARLTLGWLAACVGFAAVGLVLGLSVRYHFFALTGIAIAGGVALAWLWRRGRLGVMAAGLVGLAWVGSGLAFWYTRIMTYLH